MGAAFRIWRRRTAGRHMGTATSALSEAVSQGYIHESSYMRQAEYLPCPDIDKQARERFERFIEDMKRAQGITERLKEENALEWTGRPGNIRACAREIVNGEIIYA